MVSLEGLQFPDGEDLLVTQAFTSRGQHCTADFCLTQCLGGKPLDLNLEASKSGAPESPSQQSQGTLPQPGLSHAEQAPASSPGTLQKGLCGKLMISPPKLLSQGWGI